MKYGRARLRFRRPWALSTLAVALLGLLATGCRGPELASFPGPPEGVRLIAEEFLKPDANPLALTMALEPADEDYAAVFDEETLSAARLHYDGFWATPSWIVSPAPGQTQFRIEMATSEQLAAGTGAASQFPGGYRAIAPHLRPGLTIYEIIFVAPGQTNGVILDGLVYVNGKWRIFPAPWRVLTVNEPGHRH
ncbi:hypothetical protein ACQPZQ_10640 [Pseudonocardia sp. CA-142604]|uniref:hypothetical protein n=1 Tax=Pseudonocardia sp. CA-142604 TaxID=3240024 RepID=UPI003D93CB17